MRSIYGSFRAALFPTAVFGCTFGAAVAADKKHARIERLPLVRLQVVDEQPLALLDAVLLAADGDDRVAHKRGKRGPHGPARRGL